MTIRNAWSAGGDVQAEERRKEFRNWESNSFTVKFLPELSSVPGLLGRGVMVCID